MIRAILAGLLVAACDLASGSDAHAAQVPPASAEVAPEPLAEDDECLSGACGISALQLRAKPAVNATSDMEEALEQRGASSDLRLVHRRRRRRRRSSNAYHRRRHRGDHAFKRPTWGWLPTKVDPYHTQPTHCMGFPLMKGRQGCCGGHAYNFDTHACCGQVVYEHAKLSCCNHLNGYATIYHPYSQNCCDDPAVKNKRGGICDVPKGDISCCNRAVRTHRRRRRSRRLAEVEGDVVEHEVDGAESENYRDADEEEGEEDSD